MNFFKISTPRSSSNSRPAQCDCVLSGRTFLKQYYIFESIYLIKRDLGHIESNVKMIDWGEYYQSDVPSVDLQLAHDKAQII